MLDSRAFVSPTAVRVAAVRDFSRAWRQTCPCSLESAGVREEGARLECGACGAPILHRRRVEA